MKNKSLLLLLVIALFVSACSPSVSPTEDLPTPIPTEELTSIPAPTDPAPQPEKPIATSWKAVRDPRYGFGLAIPCWWLVSPIPAEGFGGAMTIKNYDEAYFNANSNKGFWDWPNGSLKLDVIIMEGIDLTNSDIDGYLQFSDPTMESVVSVESQQFGSHNATVATLINPNNQNDSKTIVYFFRLAPDKLLMVNPIPQNIIDTPDFQAILTTIALTPEEQIALPTIPPTPALIDASCAQ